MPKLRTICNARVRDSARQSDADCEGAGRAEAGHARGGFRDLDLRVEQIVGGEPDKGGGGHGPFGADVSGGSGPQHPAVEVVVEAAALLAEPIPRSSLIIMASLEGLQT